ncbi:MAG: hypothetical protein A2099_07200 [Planctomycetes bacterium GWF2_39_10]|nr:MAG: hypothetical protein A2Y09_07860 [Planctomycetes bacterium GWA2_39_15]OHB47357.1 MAG: hypothetical protein A2099_07200 [Planctomycetes bacterium GWF2_39_10]
MKLRYLLSYSVNFLVFFHRIHELLSSNSLNCVRVLTYHHIPESKLWQFKHQINYLASKYVFITPVQFQEFVQKKQHISGINLLITFDDGFKSNFLVAKEVLNPLGIKGIFFVPTNFIGQSDRKYQKEFIVKKIFNGDNENTEISSDMEPLTWGDLKYLLEHGHVIGSHGYHHRCLSLIYSQNDLYEEIIESGDMLEKKLGVPISYFAYPFGDINSINKHTVDLIKGRYKYCFSGVRGANYFPVSSYAILRDSISLNDPLMYVRFIIENGVDIMYRRKIKKLLALTRDRVSPI